MKSRLRVSCQFEARSDARPEAVESVRIWLTKVMRLALVSSFSRSL